MELPTGIGVLVTESLKPGVAWKLSLAAAAAAALAYTWLDETGAERSVRVSRGRPFTRSERELKVSRRVAEWSRCPQGLMPLSLTSTAASALSTAAREVRIRFMSTLESSWIKKTVLNITKQIKGKEKHRY
jgi:hypothetical protein